ncbi:MazG nucleotide pyrophosphohydrolase domain-containing protein [Actinokineospora sp. 24-640]
MLSVLEFHTTFGLPVNATPTREVGDDLAKLRVDLLEEEVGEFADASKRQDVIGLADALGDIVYVAYGAAATYGIDLDSVLAEIHRSNMSKLGADGRPVYRNDGKVLKSALYTAPDIAAVLNAQPPLTVPGNG